MNKTDRMLWEQELATYLREHCVDLADLPAPAPMLRRRRRYWVTRLLLWTPVALVGSTVGWSIGYFMI